MISEFFFKEKLEVIPSRNHVGFSARQYFTFLFSARLLCYFSPLRSLWNLCLCRFVQWLLAKNQKQKWLQFLMFQPVLIRESRKGEEGLKMEWYGMNFHWESGIWKKKSLYFPPGRIKHYFGKFIIRITCPSFSAQFHTFGRGENLSARVGMSWPSLSIGSTFSFLPSKWNVISKPFQFFYDLIYFHLIYISLAICIKLIWLLLVLMEVNEVDRRAHVWTPVTR